MTATVIPFPYNDQPRSDEQRGHVQPPTDLMEAWAILEAAGLWEDAKDPIDRATAMRRMTRILQYGSPAASEVVSRWLDNVLGPAPADSIGDQLAFDQTGDRFGLIGSDYAD